MHFVERLCNISGQEVVAGPGVWLNIGAGGVEGVGFVAAARPEGLSVGGQRFFGLYILQTVYNLPVLRIDVRLIVGKGQGRIDRRRPIAIRGFDLTLDL